MKLFLATISVLKSFIFVKIWKKTKNKVGISVYSHHCGENWRNLWIQQKQRYYQDLPVYCHIELRKLFEQKTLKVIAKSTLCRFSVIMKIILCKSVFIFNLINKFNFHLSKLVKTATMLCISLLLFIPVDWLFLLIWLHI